MTRLDTRKKKQTRIVVPAADKKRFLKCLAEYPSVLNAAKRAKVNRTSMYSWRQRDPEFAADWEEARLAGVDVLEQVAVHRATEGEDVPLIYQGKIQLDEVTGKPVTVKRVSDILLMFLMKAANPVKYRDNASIKLTGQGRSPVEPKTLADLMRLAATPTIDQAGNPVG